MPAGNSRDFSVDHSCNSGSKSYSKCMCAISINPSRFIGEVRFTLIHKSGTRALCFTEDHELQRKIKDSGAKLPRGVCLQSFMHCSEIFASCKEAARQKDEGAGRGKDHGTWQFMSPQHRALTTDSSWLQLWTVQSLLAIGQWSAPFYYAHICHAAVVTLPENFMLRLGKTVL